MVGSFMTRAMPITGLTESKPRWGRLTPMDTSRGKQRMIPLLPSPTYTKEHTMNDVQLKRHRDLVHRRKLEHKRKELDPDSRSWYYDGDGTKRDKRTNGAVE